jgi:cellobiose transport system permease protein
MKRKLLYLSLIGVLLFSAFPLYFSLVVSTKDNSALAEVSLIPGKNLIDNITRVFETVPFGQAILNSLMISCAVTASVVLFSTLAGFAFAKLKFKGRTGFLMAVVATMMVPAQLGIIPAFMLITKLGWHDTMYAVIVPALVNAFGVFFMTQYLSEALPTELIEAGKVDGAVSHRLFWHVVLPVARPAMAVLGMLTFLGTWNDYLWPLVVLASPENQTVQVALSQLRAGYVQDYSMALTGTMLATFPLIIVFGALGKQLIGGIMQGAIKG